MASTSPVRGSKTTTAPVCPAMARSAASCVRRSIVVTTWAPGSGSSCSITRTGRPSASTSIRSPPSRPRRYSSSRRSSPFWPMRSPRRYRPCRICSSLTSRTYPSRCAANVLAGYTRWGSASTTTPGSSSRRSSILATSRSDRPRRTRTDRIESAGTRARLSWSSWIGIRRSTEIRASTVSRSSISRGIRESVNEGRLSTRASPFRSTRMPRGAAIGRMRTRFFSDSSRSRSPSSTCRYQSWPIRQTKPARATADTPRTRRPQASRRVPGSGPIPTPRGRGRRRGRPGRTGRPPRTPRSAGPGAGPHRPSRRAGRSGSGRGAARRTAAGPRRHVRRTSPGT